MKAKKLLVLLAFVPLCFRVHALGESPEAGRTHCDFSLPIHVELVPLSEPHVGQAARFGVEVESDLYPDLVQDARVEYELRVRIRRVDEARSGRRAQPKQG